MTDSEWLASNNPTAMLNHFRQQAQSGRVPAITDRRLRLFACACARQAWHLLGDPRLRNAVEVAERFTKQEATRGELAAAWGGANDANRPDNGGYTRESVIAATCAAHPPDLAITLPNWVRGRSEAALLRCIVGNPFCPPPGNEQVGRQHVCERCGHHFDASNFAGLRCPECRTDNVRKWRVRDTWITPDALRIATAVYNDRDFSPEALLVLADALEEAGCTEELLLRHLRGQELCPRCVAAGLSALPYSDLPDTPCPDCNRTRWMPLRGPHSLGCFAVDCVLGKN